MSESFKDPANPYNKPDILNRKKTTLPVVNSSATTLPNRDIQKIRLERELSLLNQRGNLPDGTPMTYKHFAQDKTVLVNDLVMIIYGKSFPFEKPQIKFAIDTQYAYLSLFDLQKLEFRDIMKEDYHPSLNFAEIASRSLTFLQKNVTFINTDPKKKEEAAAASSTVLIQTKTTFFYKFISGLYFWDQRLKGSLHWQFCFFYAMAQALLFLVIGFFAPSPPEMTRTAEVANVLKQFSLKYGDGFDEVNPVTSNLAVFYIHKALVFLSSAGEELTHAPNASELLANPLPLKGFEAVYFIGLRWACLILQCLLMYLPIAFIIESIYKKNSGLFKCLLTILALTSCQVFSLTWEVDFQGILFCGLFLWTHAFMLRDNLVGALICYGLSLMCSLDSLLFWPFIVYRTSGKLLKQLYREKGIYLKGAQQTESLYRDNNLDISLLMGLVTHLQTSVGAFFIGLLVPMVPYFMSNVDLNAFLSRDFTPFGDALQDEKSIYNRTVVNPHNQWSLLMGSDPVQVAELYVPNFMIGSWYFFLNVMVITFSRANRNLGSHKKHLLQFSTILAANMLLGSPKQQSHTGSLCLMSILLIILYSEFSQMALIFSLVVHLSYIGYYSESLIAMSIFLGLVLLNQFMLGRFYRKFISVVFEQQVIASTKIKQNSKELPSDPELQRALSKMKKNEAFRVKHNQLVKQMTLQGKVGFARTVLEYQDLLFRIILYVVFPLAVISSLLASEDTAHGMVHGMFAEYSVFLFAFLLALMGLQILLSHNCIKKKVIVKPQGCSHGCSHGHSHGHHQHGQPTHAHPENQQEKPADRREAEPDGTMGLASKEKAS